MSQNIRQITEKEQTFVNTRVWPAYKAAYFPSSIKARWEPLMLIGDCETENLEIETIKVRPRILYLPDMVLGVHTILRHDECERVKISMISWVDMKNTRNVDYGNGDKEVDVSTYNYEIVASSQGHAYVFDAERNICLHHLDTSRIVLKDVIFSQLLFRVHCKEFFWQTQDGRWFTHDKKEV